MAIGFDCSCGKSLKAMAGTSGCLFRCPACGRQVEVPALDAIGSRVLPDDDPADFPRMKRPIRLRNKVRPNRWVYALVVLLVLSLLGLLTPFASESAICLTIAVAGLGIIQAIKDAASSSSS